MPGTSIVRLSLFGELPGESIVRLSPCVEHPGKSIVRLSPCVELPVESIVRASLLGEAPGKSIVRVSLFVDAPGESIVPIGESIVPNDRLAGDASIPRWALSVKREANDRPAGANDRLAGTPREFLRDRSLLLASRGALRGAMLYRGFDVLTGR